jgi:hypothetical protein
MAFLDVPYNVRVRSIGGLGRVKHAEFAFASGEMTPPDYVEFLEGALGNATRVSRDGAVHFVCCDWWHLTEIMESGRLAYGEILNIVVWVNLVKVRSIAVSTISSLSSVPARLRI